jgi:hypothetical protein
MHATDDSMRNLVVDRQQQQLCPLNAINEIDRAESMFMNRRDGDEIILLVRALRIADCGLSIVLYA